jgi:hypothetical protein
MKTAAFPVIKTLDELDRSSAPPPWLAVRLGQAELVSRPTPDQTAASGF